MENKRLLLDVLDGRCVNPPPIWLMRQAGRYLPEYQEIRKKAGSFLNLCYTPNLACEVTLQPIRRFNLDAAILFSDILVIPDALGRRVDFIQGEGPILDPLVDVNDILKLDPTSVCSHLEPVFEAIRQIRQKLPVEMTLLGFCGAPWTVATYMIAGKGSVDQKQARLFSYQYPDAFEILIERLVESSIVYLVRQLQEGVDAVQVFDSWAGVLTGNQFERFCIEPMQKIVAGVRAIVPNARIIGFPKGAGAYYELYAQKTGINCVGLDWSVPLDFARDRLANQVAVQGNIDPLLMIYGGKALEYAVDRIMKAFAGKPHIINLGHGITPEGRIENVEHLIRCVRH